MNFLKPSLGLLALALTAYGCSHTSNHQDHDHDHDPAHNHADGDTAACGETAHADEIIVSEETVARMGIEVAQINPADFREVITTSGEILPAPTGRAVAVAPVAGIVTYAPDMTVGATVTSGKAIASVAPSRVAGGNPNSAARAAMEAAKRELDRATPLRADGIVSEKEYAALHDAYIIAKAAYSPAAASGAATAPITGTVTALLANQGEYVEVGQPVARISANRTLTLRADLPLRHASRFDNIEGANFQPAGSTMVYSLADYEGRRNGSGASAEVAGAYLPLYFTFNNPGGDAVPGIVGTVSLLGKKRSGVLAVPNAALTEQMGEKYLYVKVDDHGFERRLVKTGASDGINTEILTGIKAGETVVTAGAAAVRLAEMSGKALVADPHDH